MGIIYIYALEQAMQLQCVECEVWCIFGPFPNARSTVHDDISGQACWFTWKYFQLSYEIAFNYAICDVSLDLHISYF